MIIKKPRISDIKLLNSIESLPDLECKLGNFENKADLREISDIVSNPYLEQGPFYVQTFKAGRYVWFGLISCSKSGGFRAVSATKEIFNVAQIEVTDFAYVDNGMLIGGISFRHAFYSLKDGRKQLDLVHLANFYIPPVTYNWGRYEHIFMQYIGYGDLRSIRQMVMERQVETIPVAGRAPIPGKIRSTTPLNYATSLKRIDVIELLSTNGFDLNNCDERGITPIFIAASIGEKDLLLRLIQKGAQVDPTDNRGLTPLHIAIVNAENSAAKVLIENGASVHAKDEFGSTPLHRVTEDSVDLIQYLVRAGANVHSTDNEGETPLHHAVVNGDTGVIAKLVELGGNLYLKNDSGETPLSLADAEIREHFRW